VKEIEKKGGQGLEGGRFGGNAIGPLGATCLSGDEDESTRGGGYSCTKQREKGRKENNFGPCFWGSKGQEGVSSYQRGQN